MVDDVYVIEWCCNAVSHNKCYKCGRSFLPEPLFEEETRPSLLWVSLLTAAVLFGISGFVLYVWEFV